MAEFRDLVRQTIGTRSQAEVARAIRYDPGTFSRALNGIIPFTAKMALRLAAEYPELRQAALKHIEDTYSDAAAG